MSAETADQSQTVEKAPLNEVMLAMDVVDTLRHRQDLVVRELSGESRERQLIDRLRDIYHQQGIDVPDHILKEGVAALEQDRFVYEPAPASLQRSLAEFYVAREKWGKPVLVILTVLVLSVGAYFFAYRPYVAAQAEQARIELAEQLPAQMQDLYNTIALETKIQSADSQAEAILNRGQTAASEGDRAGAEDAIARLTALRDELRQEYTLRVVNREGVRSGFWTFPEVNQDATNYYIVVEALDANGQALTLPVLNEETGETERVAMWGVRVPEDVYDSIAADKQDNGIIEANMIGVKTAGFLEPKYAVPVVGGTVTRW